MFNAKSTMKRHREFIEEFSGVLKKPKQGGRSLIFDELCNYLDGIYVYNRFIGFTLPKKTDKLEKMIKTIVGKKMTVEEFLKTDWTNNQQVLTHRILRVVLNIDLYNEHFSLTQKYDHTFKKSIDEINKSIHEKIKEEDMFEDIVKGNKYNTIIPYYFNGNIVEPYEWGVEVMNCIHEYFKTGDRKFVEMGNKEKCMELLEGPLLEKGLVKHCQKVNHPPIPTDIKRTPDTFVFKSSRNVYIPTMSFYDINFYDTTDKPININSENVKYHHIENYKTLDQETTCCVTIGCGMYGMKSIHEFKSLPPNTKSVVLVFKNNGEMKDYELLDHVLCQGLKRVSGLFKYIIPPKQLGKIVCYVTLKKFN